jgi:drug/metabolite transporter (DMT)-like permease
VARTPQSGDLHICASHRSPGWAALWTSLLILVALFWGNTFIAAKHIVEHVMPLELVVMRFLPTALVLAALLLPVRGRQAWRLPLLARLPAVLGSFRLLRTS